MPSESSIVAGISRYLKANKIWHMKVHGNGCQRVGIPDIIGCVGGQMFALEVKRPGEKASKIQQYEIGKLRESGAVAEVVESVTAARQLIEPLL